MQFAGIEQQLKSNEQLKSLVEIEKSAQATQALVYVGNTVAVDGSKAQFDKSATWNFKSDKDTSATITITNSAGQTAYSGNYTLKQGGSSFVWDGKGNDGVQWPAGTYTLTATGKDSSGQQRGDLHRSPGHRRFSRSHRLPAAALDRRAELHHRQDQARGPSEHLAR